MRAFWLALTFCLLTTALAEERAVQLLLPSRRLEPTSTFELRFAAEMVPADQIGRPAAVSPLVFSPAMIIERFLIGDFMAYFPAPLDRTPVI